MIFSYLCVFAAGRSLFLVSSKKIKIIIYSGLGESVCKSAEVAAGCFV